MVHIGPFVPNKSSSEVPSLSESGHPKRSVTEVPATVGHWSGLFPVGSSPNPSLSASSHCVESFGNASSPSANPSLSRSEQPRLPNSVDVPKVVGQLSAFTPVALSPYPSPSWSAHWLGSDGNASAPSAVVQVRSPSEYPSLSESRHPNRSSKDVPASATHESPSVAGSGSSPYPSPSESAHWVESPKNTSAPSATVQTEPLIPVGSGSEEPSPSSSGHPFLSREEKALTVLQASAPFETSHTPSLLEYPSPSPSKHPNRSRVELPSVETHASGWKPTPLSPYPSKSWSAHCVLSDGNASAPFETSQTPSGFE